MNCIVNVDRIAANNFAGFSDLCKNVIQYLLLNNENIWKLLKYNTPDALSKDNLTLSEKRDLIYTGTEDSEDYKVFRTPFVDEAFRKEVSQIRVYSLTINPNNRSVSTIDIAIDCITHIKLANLIGNGNRLELLVEEVLKTLNGQDINGVGTLFFDMSQSTYDGARCSIFNNRYFYGFQIVMSVKYGNLGNCS